MDTKELRGQLADVIKTEADIDEVIQILEESKNVSNDNISQEQIPSSIAEIEFRLLDEKDWRKRAQLAAMKISKELDR